MVQRSIWHETQVNESSNIIFTTYFCHKENPQNVRENAPFNDIDYIYPWYTSVEALSLNGVVFHDGLSEDFIANFTTRNIRFVRCTLGHMSLNDERFLIYLEYINSFCPNLDSVFMTDGNDVSIQHNPFHYIESFNDDVIFVGRNNGNRIRQSLFNMDRLPQFEQSFGVEIENRFIHQALYNAGILGGKIEVVKRFLEQITAVLLSCKGGNNNMMAFNYVLFKYWNSNANSLWNRFLGLWMTPKIYTSIRRIKHNGLVKKILNVTPNHSSFDDRIANRPNIHTSGPFCSPFKKYSTDQRYIFIHK